MELPYSIWFYTEQQSFFIKLIVFLLTKTPAMYQSVILVWLKTIICCLF